METWIWNTKWDPETVSASSQLSCPEDSSNQVSQAEISDPPSRLVGVGIAEGRMRAGFELVKKSREAKWTAVRHPGSLFTSWLRLHPDLCSVWFGLLSSISSSNLWFTTHPTFSFSSNTLLLWHHLEDKCNQRQWIKHRGRPGLLELIRIDYERDRLKSLVAAASNLP